MKKGAIQIDFIIAIGIFIIIFALVIQTVTTFFKTSESTAETYALTAQANRLLSLADFGMTPGDWNGTGIPDRIGLATKAFRFYILVNNSKDFYRNQSMQQADISSELVSFNYTSMGFRIDTNSTVVYDGGNQLPYSINSDNISFAVPISAGETKTISVYFDDDSNFTSRSVIITGTDYLTETLLAVQPVWVMQYRKISVLNSSNYDALKEKTGDFHLKLIDLSDSSAFLDFGGVVPRTGNVVALQRYFLFQNSTAGIRNGKIVVQAW